jgi:hypothetical protein
MSSLARCLALSVTLALAAAPGAAFAASPAELEAARKLFAEAERDQQADNWDVALRKLNAIAAVKDTAGVRFHIGNCLEHLGRLLDALESFQKAQALAQDSQTRDVLQLVSPRIESLRVRIPTLTIRLSSADRDAVVHIDDKPVDRTMIGAPVGLDPGTHRVAVEFPMLAPIRRELTLVESRAETIDFVRPSAVATASQASAPSIADTSPSAQPHDRAGVPVVAWVSFGAAALLASGGFLAYQKAGSVADDSASVCARSVACDSNRASVVHRYDAIALGLWSGAVAAMGTGLVLSLSPRKSSSPVAVLAFPPGAILMRGSF